MDARKAKAFLERLCAELAAQQKRLLPAAGLAMGLSACSGPQETTPPPPVDPPEQVVTDEQPGEVVALYAAPTIERLEPVPEVVPAYAAPSPELGPYPPIDDSAPVALYAAPAPELGPYPPIDDSAPNVALYAAPAPELGLESSVDGGGPVALYDAPSPQPRPQLRGDQVELMVALYDAPTPTPTVRDPNAEPLDGNYYDAVGLELGKSRAGKLTPKDGDKADWLYLRIPKRSRLLLSVRFENAEAEAELIVRDAAREELSRLSQTGTQAMSLETPVDAGIVYLELRASGEPTAYTIETKLQPAP